MKLPDIGSLNRRISLYLIRQIPEGEFGLKDEREKIAEVWAKREVVGGQNYWQSVNLEETVTHRFFVRWVKVLTRPVDLAKIVEIECEEIRYRVRRVTDVNDAHLFTMLECEELGHGHAI